MTTFFIIFSTILNLLLETIKVSFQSEKVSDDENELSECKDNHNNVKPISDNFWRLVVSRD